MLEFSREDGGAGKYGCLRALGCGSKVILSLESSNWFVSAHFSSTIETTINALLHAHMGCCRCFVEFFHQPFIYSPLF